MGSNNSFGKFISCILFFLAFMIFFSCGEEVTVSPLNGFRLPVLNRSNTRINISTDHVKADGVSNCIVSVTPVSSTNVRMGRGLDVEFFSTHGSFIGDVLYDPATSMYYQTLKPAKDETGIAEISVSINGQYLFENEYVEFYLGVYFSNKNLENVIKENLGKQGEPVYQEDIDGLFELTAEGAHLSDLSGIGKCSELRKVFFVDCHVSNLIPLSGLTKLEKLNLSENQIYDLAPLDTLTSLDSLDLSENYIRDLSPLAGLTKMEYLYLDYNVIQFISPLENLKDLKVLNIRSNQVSNLFVLSDLTNLDFLDLAYNEIYYIRYLVDNPGIGSGDIIYLYDNPLNNESVNSFLPALRQRGVTVYY